MFLEWGKNLAKIRDGWSFFYVFLRKYPFLKGGSKESSIITKIKRAFMYILFVKDMLSCNYN